MITQKHPEISITFRRNVDNTAQIQVATRASKDQNLSLLAQAYSQAIARRMNEIRAEVESMGAEQPQEIH